MANLYLQLTNKHQKEFNEFPMAFAFSNKQFEEGMRRLGLEPDETDKVISIGAGGFILKTDIEKYKEMYERHDEEMKSAINSSDQFILDMFNYELDNHEYCVTLDVEDTLDALGLTYDEVRNNERLSKGLDLALEQQSQREYY